jgi:hypothetical protein
MRPLLFISRHAPTATQRELAARLGFDELRLHDVSLTAAAADEMRTLGLGPGQAVALVAPLYVSLALLRAGFRVVEFVNDPAAREAGAFDCRGVYVHTLQRSTFLPAELAARSSEPGV